MTYSPSQFQKESHSVRVSKNNKNDGDPIVNKLQKNRVVKQGRISPTNVVASRKRYYNASEARIQIGAPLFEPNSRNAKLIKEPQR